VRDPAPLIRTPLKTIGAASGLVNKRRNEIHKERDKFFVSRGWKIVSQLIENKTHCLNEKMLSHESSRNWMNKQILSKNISRFHRHLFFETK